MLRTDGSAAKEPNAVAECDLLAPEAIRYGDSLQKSGADVDVQLLVELPILYSS